MDTPENDAENVAEFITRRKVARMTLKKIRGIVSVWEEEERQRVALVKALSWVLPTVFAVSILAFILLSAAFFAHPKIRLFAASILIGILGAIALIVWNRRGKNRE